MNMCDNVFQNNCAIFAATLTGKPIKKTSDSTSIRNREGLVSWYRQGFHRFIFRPCDAGLVGLDLDCKNGKDGIGEYQAITNTDPRSLPFYVITPSGGIHLYFKTNQIFISNEIAAGVEVKSKSFITLPGSRSNKGAYYAQGNPSDIEPLPESLRRVLVPYFREQPVINRQLSSDITIDFEKMESILERQGHVPSPGGRNRYVFKLSLFAARQGKDRDSVQSYLMKYAGSDFPLSEIRTTVRSAYRIVGGVR